nr:uncharacterized protein LOC106691654 [Halyomorpha halys]
MENRFNGNNNDVIDDLRRINEGKNDGDNLDDIHPLPQILKQGAYGNEYNLGDYGHQPYILETGESGNGYNLGDNGYQPYILNKGESGNGFYLRDSGYQPYILKMVNKYCYI